MTTPTPTLLLILILLPIHLTLTTCPRQCICHDHSIACSCETADKSELIISSLGSTYITSLVVHSCDKVTVLNGSFSGVVLVERLSFIAINRLYFEPHAFKDILQSPRQFVIDECSIPSLAPVAFAGLSHIDHLWFRNSKIEVIAMEAFHYLTNIDYIYFHKTKIGRIERKAFSKMYQIDHLYFKDSIHVDFIESEAFSGSQIDELIFDGVTVLKAHDTFLVNIDSENTILKNCTVDLTSRSVEHVVEMTAEQVFIARCLIESSTFNVMSPFKFGCTLLEVTSSTLERLGPIGRKSDTSVIVSEPAISSSLNSVSFSNCSIGSIDPFSFLNYTLSILHFNHSTIDTMRPRSIEKSKIHSLAFSGSILKSIEQHAIQKSKIGNFDLETMDIGVMESEWITSSLLGKLRVLHSKVERMEGNLFKDSRFDGCEVEGNRIGMMDFKAFHGSNEITSLSITANDISSSHTSPSFLSPSSHPTNFLLANNTLDCSATDCSTNSFLLNSPSQPNLLFQIAGNRCRPPISSPCIEPRVITIEEHSVTCRISSFIADCACIASSASLPAKFHISNVSIVILGDCEHLILNQKSSDFSQIYIFRTSKLLLYNLPAQLKVLKVFHSTVSLLRVGTQYSKFAMSWEFSQCSIDSISGSALSFLNLDSLTLEHSKISHIPSKSTWNSTIRSLIIDACHVESTSPLFAVSASLRMQHSLVFSSPRGLGAISSAQLQNNTLLECCERPYSNPVGLEAIELDPRCDLHFYGSKCYAVEDGEMGVNLPITSEAGNLNFFVHFAFFYTYLCLTITCQSCL